MEEQVAVLYAGVNGYLDGLKVSDIKRYEAGLLSALNDKGAGILDAIASSGKLDNEDELKAFIEDFTKSFA
jgi:F-type H+-transporting ATPase subunit alpha